MKVNLRKLMQLIVFFAYHEAVKPLGKTKLFKLLYFTDVTHLCTAGEPITGAEYLKYPYGPVPMQGAFALKELQKHRLIMQKRVQLTNTKFMREITALQMPDMTMFTEQEMITIHSVIQQYGEDTASALSWKSHQESAWLFADDWRPLTLTPAKHSTEKNGENTEAIALLEEWYATPDDKPPGYWDDLLEEIETNPLHFGDEDLEL
jgi:uncharacterized phage-associated protein